MARNDVRPAGWTDDDERERFIREREEHFRDSDLLFLLGRLDAARKARWGGMIQEAKMDVERMSTDELLDLRARLSTRAGTYKSEEAQRFIVAINAAIVRRGADID